MGYADPEQIIADWLTTAIGGTGETRIRVVTGEDFPLNVQHSQRLVRVVQILTGPGDVQDTLDIADVEINCYARTRDRVRDLANQVRADLRYRLPKTTHTSGAFVTRVRLPGSAQVPSDTSSFYRRMATARIWLHHNPLA